MSYTCIYPNYVWFSLVARKMVSTPYVFILLILLAMGERLALVSLHWSERVSERTPACKLDEYVNAILSIRRYDIATDVDSCLLQIFVWEQFSAVALKSVEYLGVWNSVPKWLEKVDIVLIQA